MLSFLAPFVQAVQEGMVGWRRGAAWVSVSQLLPLLMPKEFGWEVRMWALGSQASSGSSHNPAIQTSYFTSLGLTFLTRKMAMILPNSQSCCE